MPGRGTAHHVNCGTCSQRLDMRTRNASQAQHSQLAADIKRFRLIRRRGVNMAPDLRGEVVEVDWSGAVQIDGQRGDS
jgi:hypothetical protein